MRRMKNGTGRRDGPQIKTAKPFAEKKMKIKRRKPGAHHWWLLAIISVFNESVFLFLITARTKMVGNKLKYKIDCWLFPGALLLSQIGKRLKIAYRHRRETVVTDSICRLFFNFLFNIKILNDKSVDFIRSRAVLTVKGFFTIKESIWLWTSNRHFL